MNAALFFDWAQRAKLGLFSGQFFQGFLLQFLRNPVFTTFFKIHINANYRNFFKKLSKKSEVIEEIDYRNNKRHLTIFSIKIDF